jgi:hypothetical protein
MELFVFSLLALFTTIAVTQEPKVEQEWKSLAYIEFLPDSSGVKVKDALSGMVKEEGTTVKTNSTEKTRIESLTTVDPATGKKIVETETIRSGTNTAIQSNSIDPNRSSLVTVEELQPVVDKDGKVTKATKQKEYRIKIDDDVFFFATDKEIRRVAKIAKEYLRARQLVARGAKVQPFIELFIGDKEKGVVVYHETRGRTSESLLKMRIWIKGRSFDVRTTPAAATFIQDIANM